MAKDKPSEKNIITNSSSKAVAKPVATTTVTKKVEATKPVLKKEDPVKSIKKEVEETIVKSSSKQASSKLPIEEKKSNANSVDKKKDVIENNKSKSKENLKDKSVKAAAIEMIAESPAVNNNEIMEIKEKKLNVVIEDSKFEENSDDGFYEGKSRNYAKGLANLNKAKSFLTNSEELPHDLEAEIDVDVIDHDLHPGLKEDKIIPGMPVHDVLDDYIGDYDIDEVEVVKKKRGRKPKQTEHHKPRVIFQTKEIKSPIIKKEVISEESSLSKKMIAPPVRPIVSIRYSDKELAEFKIIITESRKEALDELRMLKERLEDLTNFDFAEESMIYSMHMAEQGSEALEQEKTYAHIQRINEYLKKLDEALQRITEKTYGICRVCGCLIAKERLIAVPITTLSASYKIHQKCPEDGIDMIEPVSR
ncbi:MAG: hypothetical protein NT007_05610 [Candidatus Kapabacteria bacterium]|nr:hypothetical protein [Candidatus Kapabacteria bacterium]